MIELKGIAWDHPRGYEPLIATSKAFQKNNPNVNITWKVRSLKEFGDTPIEDLIENFDLITIDHPYMGQAHKNGLLLKLEDYIKTEELNALKQQALGKCFDIYNYENHLYATPIDAAALVASYRKDIIDSLELSLPKNQEELKAFYKKLPSGFSVAWALCPTDIWCTFLTLCVQNYGPAFIQNKEINSKVGISVLDDIKFHVEQSHPQSLNWNPIQILDKMGNEDGIIYSPYLFGYTNYSRQNYTKILVYFINSPTGQQKNIATIMGGVGLAVSALTKHPEMASNYVSYVASAEVQEGVFTKNGGQPASKNAWESKDNNTLCHNFFKDTKWTIENAYIRPQHPGWNAFQEQGADIVHEGILKDTNSEVIMNRLNDCYKSVKL
ncbi:ABC transporter substrate-binding protein [Seonamhaeicola aphaedonensis]|uniref:Carbohydrate ABC transporter substrate-binding protein (CUT1 family) n=1 Tax=Seonamhaeicola aphaedonensis TaxID=1461338 RepID=A0A3D9HDB7_9FLAO|nr:extracellular solute-binding protein [Seonamhaeicola aphaedonensis]RED47455.1 carbohydrate ABC transporter substrate-binding protein (CUT1 family) [Seonamhaeicola aphaedonensis]